jgi:hypothetical protein
MKKKVFITFTTVNSKMWKKENGTIEYHDSSIDELKNDIVQEDVEFVNILDNLALVNYLKEAGVEVEYKEKVEYIYGNPGDIIYEFYGNTSLRECKTEENLPKFTSIAIRRHECLVK